MRPNYLVIGAQNCGTTSLCANLGKHPDVFMTNPKELHFFSDPKVFARGWGWYEEHFKTVTTETAIGEGSTTYSRNVYQPDAPDLIYRHLPNVRLIYMVRHPLRRMETHWLHRRRLRRNPLWDFERTYREVPWMLDASLFWRQISLYRENFPDDRIHVVFFEDYVKDPDMVLADCFAFLGVDETFVIPDSREAQNRSLGRRADKGSGRALRQVPGSLSLWKKLPPSLRAAIQPFLTFRLEKKPEWPEAIRAHAIEKVTPDMEKFLAFYGKPADYWTIGEL
ncbi:sulfotransferase family protein [Thiocapsa bogorovii]|uniref:sulfotransferase family protein n=1 Tax=Thiocapsa bogorovii TaxID=521689 RepID=UPI001E3D3040|nr:sulfotransferase [Thiocapsa bogorovii]UHD17124.1 sulfotransferase [Thiocapsa bogorovii]